MANLKNVRVLWTSSAAVAVAFVAFSLLSAQPAWALGAVPNGNAAAALAGGLPDTPSGFGALNPAPPTGITVEQIIKKFGDREAAFAKARNEYTFRQSVLIQTISETTNKPDGTYNQVNDIVFDDSGKRAEKVVFAPANTIERIIMTQNDFDDIAHRLPFVLTTPELPEYDLTYLGRQKVDDIDTYVFDCKPKTLEKGKRYFQGKVWVDQQELEIVLINGKSVPDNLRRGHEDLSPPYTTYYSEVDGGSWFPVYTKADGVLHFPAESGSLANNVHIRYTVKYEDYRRFHAKSRIVYNGADLPAADPNVVPPATATEPTTQPAEKPDALPPPDPNAPPIVRGKPKM